MLRSFLPTALVIMMGCLAAGCTASSERDPSSTSDLAATDYRLPGVSETLLVADGSGHTNIVHLGDPTTVVPTENGASIVAGRSFGGRFWLVDQSGALVIVDPASSAPPVRKALGLSAPADLEIDSVHSAWITNAAQLVHLDPSTGATLATLDLGDAVTAGGIKRVGDRLFVQLARANGHAQQRGAIAVVDMPAARIESVIELEVPNGAATEVGYDPGGAMVVDTIHQKLLLTARGFRPSNTGMVLRIDLATRTLDPWFYRSGAGFQGGLAPGSDPTTLFIGYHTSTPTTSTHLFHYRIKDDGELSAVHAGTILDAFEVVDDYPASASGSLFALPVTCPAGFCLGGKGVSFIDTKTGTPYPRFAEASIGMSPSFVLFL